MAQKKVFATRSNIPQKALDLIREDNTVDLEVWDSEETIPRDVLLRKIVGCHGLFVVLTEKINSEVLDAMGSQCKVVSSMSVGYDHIDAEECKRRGISVGITPEVLTSATADTAVTLLLCLMRRVPEALSSVKDGSWDKWTPSWMCGPDIRDKTVGVIGLGRIGTAIVQRLQPFGIGDVLYWGRTAKPDTEKEIKSDHVSGSSRKVTFVPELHKLLNRSDIVIISCVSNADTQGLIGAPELESMKKDALLINIARGNIIKQPDLVDALHKRSIAGAGLDVTVPEPLPLDDPLQNAPNLVIFPHIGSSTWRTREAMAVRAAHNLLAGIHDKPLPFPAP
eukprot:Clim_evm4s108 gene=Clim_evmTU4s108